MNIRIATPDDGESVLSLIAALAEYEKMDPPDAEARRRLIEEMKQEHPRFEVFLAEEEGRAVGYAIIFETYSTFGAFPVLYLEDLFVLPSYRKKKIGLALFHAVVREAQRRGCGRLEWVVLSWNTPAIGFYRKLGAHRLDEWETFRLTSDRYEDLLNN
ncbi:MAG: GNAT family N-acetyltransferase [Ignavibacteria bacterium]|nr:GNAT family N-acetyltransferase [Ignavibacteria bacterium]